MISRRGWIVLVTAAAMLVSGVALARLPIELPLWFLWGANSVVFDGETALETPIIYNPPASSHTFAMVYWRRFIGPPPDGAEHVFRSRWTFTRDVELANVQEQNAGNGTSTIFLYFYIGPGDDPPQDGGCSQFYLPASANIPYGDDQWGVALSVDNATLGYPVGQYAIWSVEHPNIYRSGFLTLTYQCPGPSIGDTPWGKAEEWSISDPLLIKGLLAEYYVDLTHPWNFSDRNEVAEFRDVATGRARGLDAPRTPQTLNCAAPNGYIPQMCHRGNPRSFTRGPEVTPGNFAYTFFSAGTLQTGLEDPCLIPGFGGGCLP